VLVCIAADPNTRLRGIAAAVGVTHRTAAHVANDLEQVGIEARAAMDAGISLDRRL
jgi:hypothetical protein